MIFGPTTTTTDLQCEVNARLANVIASVSEYGRLCRGDIGNQFENIWAVTGPE